MVQSPLTGPGHQGGGNVNSVDILTRAPCLCLQGDSGQGSTLLLWDAVAYLEHLLLTLMTYVNTRMQIANAKFFNIFSHEIYVDIDFTKIYASKPCIA